MDLTNYVDGPPDGTVVGADGLNAVEIELANVIQAAGLTLSVADLTQLLQAIGGALGVKSHATSTGSATTTHRRAIVASAASTASGPDSAVVGSASSAATGTDSAVVGSDHSTASGNRSGVVGSEYSEASGDDSAVVASDGSTASGNRSAVVCGRNVEVGTAGTVGGGENAGATITPNGTDQGLTWKVTKEGHPFVTLRTGATQGAAGAAAGELWATAGHATLPDNVVLIGV